uniref:Uncharacterized protein n=1 Tax=Cyanothece sp. (strain PCC 7425 / ATCC 29141) TaxID=395961 RepID=B8HPD8_CYAP4
MLRPDLPTFDPQVSGKLLLRQGEEYSLRMINWRGNFPLSVQ